MRLSDRFRPTWTTVFAVVFALASICSPVRADVLDSIQEAFKEWGLFQGVQITGQNQLTFQQHSVDGSESAFEGQRWDTGSLERQTSLHIEGPIWKEIGFQTDLSYSGFGNDYSRWVAGYSGHDSSLFYGDLNINLTGNEFVSFNKALSGYQLDQALPGEGLLRAFYSKDEGVTRNERIQGNNTAGPYFLSYTPVIDGSEVVKVDEQVQEFGVDYRLDYQSGQLWFEVGDNPAKIISDTSVISISYQSAGYGADAGTVSGWRAEMPLLNDRLLVGLTQVKQDRPDVNSDTVGYQEDVYQGSGSTGPFDTSYRPIIPNGTEVVYKGERKTINQSLVVLVDNVEQAEGVDYDAYRDIGRIIFRRAVPPTALVVIRYYYDLTNNYQTSDTEVTGIDLSYRISDDLSLRADFGQSDGGQDGNSGTATQVNLNYDRPGLRTLVSYRNIEPTFSYINTSGFYEQEKGTEVGVNWEPMDHVSLYTRFSDLDSAQGYSVGYGGGGYSTYGVNTAQTGSEIPTLSINSQRREYDLDLDFPGWPELTWSRQDLSNTGTGNASESSSDNVRLRWSPSDANYSLTSSFSTTTQSFAGGDEDEQSGSSSDQFELRGTYDPMENLSLAASLSKNDSTSRYDEGGSSSENMQLDLQWTPQDNLNLSLNHRISESIGSTYGSYSYYGGGGFGGIGGGGGGYAPPDEDDESDDDKRDRYEDATTQFNISYRPTDRLSLDLMASQRKYTSGGTTGYLADSDQITHNLSATYRAGDQWSFNTMWGTDEMDFLQEGRGKITNEMITLGANYQPRDKPYSGGLSLNIQNGSSPTYVGFGDAQKMFMVDNELFDIQTYMNWKLNDASSMSVRLGQSDFTGGYSDFTKNTMEISYNRTISDLLTLSAGYRYIRNVSDLPTDPRMGYTGLTAPSQDYAVSTFMVSVSTNFHSGMSGSTSRYTGYGGTTGAGLGSFGGYQSGRGFGSYGGYGSGGYGTGGYGTGSGYGGYSTGSNLGPGYGAFEQLRNTGEQAQDRLPGYGIFQGTGTDQRRQQQYTGSRGGLEAGLGDFEGEQRQSRMERPEHLEEGTGTGRDTAPPPPGMEREQWEEMQERAGPDIDRPFDPADPDYEPGTTILFDDIYDSAGATR